MIRRLNRTSNFELGAFVNHLDRTHSILKHSFSGLSPSLSPPENSSPLRSSNCVRGLRPMSGNRAQPRRPRPNYFLSLPLAHYPSLTSHIQSIQNTMKQQDPELQDFFLDPASAHLTLFVLALDDKNQEGQLPSLQSAQQCLEESLQSLESQDLAKPFSLKFKGLSHFQHRVLFLELEETEGLSILQQLYQTMSNFFTQKGVLLQPETRTDEDEFKPHLTIAKTSKVRFQKRRGRPRNTQIPYTSYARFKDFPLSEEYTIDQVQLCKMQGRKTGEYYDVNTSISFKL